MKKYSWPGNIRELENLLERWAVIFEPYAVVRWEQVAHEFPDGHKSGIVPAAASGRRRTMAETMDDYQREVLLWARAEYGTVRDMAEALGVDHSTIVKMAKRLGIGLERQHPDGSA